MILAVRVALKQQFFFLFVIAKSKKKEIKGFSRTGDIEICEINAKVSNK